ncbi:MAG: hypothetical protein JW795_02705 [Chitinivibrionales bacterium]|nr:hypothetical protein [Chitinivibrionales bacterium]
MSITTINSRLQQSIGLLRTGAYGQAASELSGISLMLQALLNEYSSKPVTRKIAYSVETVVLLIQQQDWVGVADVIEYELLTLVSQLGENGE